MSSQKAIILVALVGGGSAGVFDLIYAFILSATYDVSSTRVLQSIASGLLGPAAFDAGALTAAFGFMIHFSIAVIMAWTFALATTVLPALRRSTLPWGIAYGIFLYLVMNFIVLPLSAFPGAGKLPSLPLLIGGLAIHALGVGLPIALAARHFLTRFAGPQVRRPRKAGSLAPGDILLSGPLSDRPPQPGRCPRPPHLPGPPTPSEWCREFAHRIFGGFLDRLKRVSRP